MTPIQYDGWTLVDSQNKPVFLGEILEDFRGDQSRITGGKPPHKPSSTGRVWTAGGAEFFPSVFNCTWIKD
jgi:hypothetical protein